MKKWLAALLTIALGAAIAGGGWWVSGRFAERIAQAASAADAVASALAAGEVPAGTQAGAAQPPADLSSVLAGMGDARHEVSVAGIELVDRGDGAIAGLRHTWQVKPDTAPWVYDTRAMLRWGEHGWLLAWDPAVLAPDLTARETLSVQRLAPQRGRIVGADGAFDPAEPLARPVLGTVGTATQEQADAAPGRVEVGDTVGLTGVQAWQDETLAGKPGYVVNAVDEANTARELTRVEPDAGSDVRVSLSRAVQQAAEQTLAGVGPPAAIVAIRPSDGHLLAVANGPGSQGFSTATQGRYAPGRRSRWSPRRRCWRPG